MGLWFALMSMMIPQILTIKDSCETQKSEYEIETLFPAEEILKHICKHKKSRALVH